MKNINMKTKILYMFFLFTLCENVYGQHNYQGQKIFTPIEEVYRKAVQYKIEKHLFVNKTTLKKDFASFPYITKESLEDNMIENAKFYNLLDEKLQFYAEIKGKINSMKEFYQIMSKYPIYEKAMLKNKSSIDLKAEILKNDRDYCVTIDNDQAIVFHKKSKLTKSDLANYEFVFKSKPELSK
jgi:hypothetical protein